MRKITIIIWVWGCLVWRADILAQNLNSIEPTVLRFTPADSAQIPLCHKLTDETAFLVKLLKDFEQKENRFNGSARFGFAGDKTGAASLYKINGGISVYRGYYPDKFEFANDVGMVLSNGAFTENVSNIFITYDHSLPVGDSLFLENYAVMSRFSDEFLGIEQRYELGGGFIVARWSKKLTAKGRQELTAVSRLTLANTGADTLLACISGDCAAATPTSPTDAAKLIRAQQMAKTATRKRYNTFRVALLTGLFLETEKGFAADTLTTAAGKIYRKQSFSATQYLRWEFRPTIDLKPNDQWALKIRPYFKMPMPWEWYSQTTQNGFTSKAVDYRIDLQTSLSIKLAEGSGKQASFEVQYRVLYDNAPKRAFTELLTDAGAPALLSAQKMHQLVRVMFQVGF